MPTYNELVGRRLEVEVTLVQEDEDEIEKLQSQTLLSTVREKNEQEAGSLLLAFAEVAVRSAYR